MTTALAENSTLPMAANARPVRNDRRRAESRWEVGDNADASGMPNGRTRKRKRPTRLARAGRMDLSRRALLCQLQQSHRHPAVVAKLILHLPERALLLAGGIQHGAGVQVTQRGAAVVR